METSDKIALASIGLVGIGFIVYVIATSKKYNLYVSPDGNDNNDGSSNSPLKTISQAIEVSKQNDNILVLPGTYNERVIINKPVKLIGQNAIIDGSDLPYPGSLWERGLVEIRSNDVDFSGFRVQNSKSSGIITVNSNNIGIKYNHTFNTWSSGIQIHDGSNIKVGYNNIEDAANSLDYSTLGNPQENLSIASPRNNLSGFEVAYNYIHGGNVNVKYNAGIYCKQGCKNGLIHHNYISNISYSNGMLYIDAWDLITANIEAYKNLIVGGEGFGVSTERGGSLFNINIHDNIVTGGTRGLNTPDTSYEGIISGLIIKNNIFYKNNTGIRFGNSNFDKIPSYSNVLISNNIICNNTLYQIRIDNRIPSSAYVLSNNKTDFDYITQEKFNNYLNNLYNEISRFAPIYSTDGSE